MMLAGSGIRITINSFRMTSLLVILSAAKDLLFRPKQVLRFAQDDSLKNARITRHSPMPLTTNTANQT